MGDRSGLLYPGEVPDTVWSFIILAELGAYGRDSRVRQACEFILENSQDRQSGAFAYLSTASGGGDHYRVIPCLTGNLLWSLIRFGYLEDPRVQKGIDWMGRYQRCDDGVPKAPAGWPYEKFANWWGKHTCHLGAVKIMEVLGTLVGLGYHDKRMQDAVDLVVSKQDEHGKWILDRTFNGRTPVSIERKGQPSKWITLRAITALRRFYE